MNHLENLKEEEIIKKAAAAYQRNWRKMNPERVKEINTRFWLKKAMQLLEGRSE